MNKWICIIMLLCVSPVMGANVNWDGEAGNGDWFTGSNWSTDSIPATADTARFTSTDPNVTVAVTNDVTVAILTTLNAGTRTINLNSNTLNVTTYFQLSLGDTTFNGGYMPNAYFLNQGAGLRNITCNNMTMDNYFSTLTAVTATLVSTNILNECTINFIPSNAFGVVRVGEFSGANANSIIYEAWNSCISTNQTMNLMVINQNRNNIASLTNTWCEFLHDSPSMTTTWGEVRVGYNIGGTAIFDFRNGTMIIKNLNFGTGNTYADADDRLEMSGGTIYATNTVAINSAITTINHSGGDLYLAKTYGDPTTNSWYTVPEGFVATVTEETGYFKITVVGAPTPPATSERKLYVPNEYNAILNRNLLWP